MADIAGTPMIGRVYQQAVLSRAFSAVYVATDHPGIQEYIVSIGGNAILTGEHDNGTMRVAEAIRKIPGNYDIIINLQGDQPIIPPGVIPTLIKAFQDPLCVIATLAKHSRDKENYLNPNLVKVTFNNDSTAGEFSRDPIPGTENDDYFYHIGIYAFRKDVLEKLVHLPPSPDEIAQRLEQLRWMYHGYPIHIKESSNDIQAIDVPEDIQKVLHLLKDQQGV
jgi:3-deoxy-manno-octulosonate cytidylyltransferase (CMP-KDO synthetase)